VRILRKGFGNPASLDLSVFLATIALLGNFDKRSVNNTTCFGDKTFSGKRLLKALEQLAFDICAVKLFAEKPNRAGVGNFVGSRKTEKILERKTIANLQLGLFVGKVVKIFEDKNFADEDVIVGLFSAFGLRFHGTSLVNQGTKRLKVNKNGNGRKNKF
jgi:hypothetical protein